MRQRNVNVWITVFVIVLFASACTSLKRFAYEGYKRDEWQKPEEVVAALQIKPGSHVVDLGSGGGYFTFRLAEAAGDNGQVYAIDVDEGLLEFIEQTAKEKDFTNIKTVLAPENDPGLQANKVDLIFLCNTYHHLDNRVEYFKNTHKYLNPQGRVVIIEFTSGWLNTIGHGTATEEISTEMQQAGYELSSQFDFLEKQNFLVFQLRK